MAAKITFKPDAIKQQVHEIVKQALALADELEALEYEIDDFNESIKEALAS